MTERTDYKMNSHLLGLDDIKYRCAVCDQKPTLQLQQLPFSQRVSFYRLICKAGCHTGLWRKYLGWAVRSWNSSQATKRSTAERCREWEL